MKNPVLVSLSTVPPIPCFISFHLVKLQGNEESRVNLIKEKRNTGNRWNEWKVMETRTGTTKGHSGKLEGNKRAKRTKFK